MQLRNIVYALILGISFAVAPASAENHHLTMTDAAEPHSAVVTKEQALEAVQNVERPAGVTLTGSVEPLQKTEDGDNDEQFGYGLGGIDGGMFGPWRFGFSCGGLGGWAYPLGYWNSFGAGLYGGGCGLGLATGGLFYC